MFIIDHPGWRVNWISRENLSMNKSSANRFSWFKSVCLCVEHAIHALVILCLDDICRNTLESYMNLSSYPQGLLQALGKSTAGGALAATQEVMTILLQGLEKFHKEKLVHRDIKPSNILVLEESKKTKVKSRSRTTTRTSRTTCCMFNLSWATVFDMSKKIWSVSTSFYELVWDVVSHIGYALPEAFDMANFQGKLIVQAPCVHTCSIVTSSWYRFSVSRTQRTTQVACAGSNRITLRTWCLACSKCVPLNHQHLVLFECTQGGLRLIDLGACADLNDGFNFVLGNCPRDPTYCPPECDLMPADLADGNRYGVQISFGTCSGFLSCWFVIPIEGLAWLLFLVFLGCFNLLHHAIWRYGTTGSMPEPTVCCCRVEPAKLPEYWNTYQPSSFDIYSAGVVMMQLAVPRLRSEDGLKKFNSEILECEYSLMAWKTQANLSAGTVWNEQSLSLVWLLSTCMDPNNVP